MFLKYKIIVLQKDVFQDYFLKFGEHSLNERKGKLDIFLNEYFSKWIFF